MVSKGNHPQMAELFRLVNYYNLPRYHGRSVENQDVFFSVGRMIYGHGVHIDVRLAEGEMSRCPVVEVLYLGRR